MDAVKLHLLLNHLPIMGTLFGAGLLFYALIRRKEDVLRASFGLLVVAGLGGVATYYSGESAEGLVEDLPGISHEVIEAHEDIAFFAYLSSIVIGLAALGVLIGFRKRTLPGWVGSVMGVLALVALGILGYTGYQGGQIRHSEIHADPPAPDAADPEAVPVSSIP